MIIPIRRAISVAVILVMQAPSFAAEVDRPRNRADIITPQEKLRLAFPGEEAAVSYKKYGRFENVGTDRYRYNITNKRGLAKAAGEGVFPNTDVTRDPAFHRLNKKRLLLGSHWDFIDNPNPARNFYKWASIQENAGIKQFYLGVMFERLGMISEAIKAYYAVVVHFPRTVSLTYYDTPWYVGPASIDRINLLLRWNPHVNMVMEGADIRVSGKFDVDTMNDAFFVNPGRLMNVRNRKPEKVVDVSKLKVIRTLGGTKTQLRQYSNRHWQMFVDGKPFQIKAVTYSIAPVGVSPDRGTWNVSRDWQLIDTNNNGMIDGFFESFVDANQNGARDADEPVVGDAKLLQEMGVNTLRAYHHIYNKELFRELYRDYGIHVLCGDVIGMYAVGSGATWTEGTDYTNPKHQESMLEGVRKMVEEYKDEPYVIMWVLGNENVYGVANNSDKNPDAFFKFVNRAARLIHELDPTRPVALSNGDLKGLDQIQRHCPDLDVMGANVYRGELGFGTYLFRDVYETLDRPFLVTEYGASAFAEGYTQRQAEEYQAMYVANNWEDMVANMAGRGYGNALGGVLFEFIDEWWKANSDLPESVQKRLEKWYAPRSAIYKSLRPDKQDVVPQFGFPFLDGWSYEEWYGLISQGTGKGSPFARYLRPSYYTMRQLWTGVPRPAEIPPVPGATLEAALAGAEEAAAVTTSETSPALKEEPVAPPADSPAP